VRLVAGSPRLACCRTSSRSRVMKCGWSLMQRPGLGQQTHMLLADVVAQTCRIAGLQDGRIAGMQDWQREQTGSTQLSRGLLHTELVCTSNERQPEAVRAGVRVG
jgi:hypothetical protein